MIAPPPEQPRPGAPVWMVTFADLMSLLLTFFVLLLSFSSMEIAAFQTMSGSMRNAFGLRSPLDLRDAQVHDGAQAPDASTAARLRRVLEASPLENLGNVEVRDRGIALRLSGDAVFPTGRTDLSPAARDLLERLVAVVGTAPGEIEVEGHTDDVPIRNEVFPSNWELSAARAGAAVRYLTGRGVSPLRIRAIGCADTRPLVPNDSDGNRRKNRRIEIVFFGGTGEGGS